MSQFAVIGLGRFGANVARSLFQGGHEVLALDVSAAAVQDVKDHSTRALVLDARQKERLAALGIEQVDVVILSLGDRIEASAVVALHLKDLGVKRIIAKAGSEDQSRLLQLIGVDEIISPERQAAERLANRLRGAGTLDFIPLGAHYSIHEITPPRIFRNSTLAELKIRNRFGVQVLAVRDARTDELEVNPPADFSIGEHHILLVLGANADIDKLRQVGDS
jgi:trk system potassium uptake protein TrkA